MKLHQNCFQVAAVGTFLFLLSGTTFAACADYIGTYYRLRADVMSGQRYYAIYSISDEGNFYRVVESRDGKVVNKLVAECENNKLVIQAGLGKLSMYLNRARDIEMSDETWSRGSPPSVSGATVRAQGSRQTPKLDYGVVQAVVGLGLDRPTKAMPSQFHVRNTISGKTHTFQFEGLLEPSLPWVFKTRLVESKSPGDSYLLFGMLGTLHTYPGSDGEWATTVMKNLTFTGDWKNKRVGSKIEASFQMQNSGGVTPLQSIKCQVRGEVPASAISNKFSGGARYLDCTKYSSSSGPGKASYVFFDDYQYAFGIEQPSFLGAKAQFVFVDGP